MTGKITAILAAAVVLASAGVASAQPGRAHARWQAPLAGLSTITEITGRESKESRPIKRLVLTCMLGRSFQAVLQCIDGGQRHCFLSISVGGRVPHTSEAGARLRDLKDTKR